MRLKNELIKGSAVVSVITFLGHLLSTGLKLLISRNYGVIGFGKYALIMALSRFLSTVVQMGFNQSIVHFVSKFRAKEDWSNINHFFISGIIQIIKVASVVMISLLLFQDILLRVINLENGGLYTVLFVSAISSIIAINNFISGSLRGLKLFKEQAILFTSTFPFLMIISLLGLKWFPVGSPTIYQFLFVGILLNVIILIIAFVLTKGIISKQVDPLAQKSDIKGLTKYSMPIWLSSVLQNAFTSSDRIMLGIFSSLSQVGIYGAGLTFSILFAFPLKAMGPVFQPYIIEYYSNNDYAGINKMYNMMVRWSSLFVIPAFSGLLCFGDHLIQIFGIGFERAYEVMIILSIAQMISTISGIAGTMLNLTEKQGSHTKIMAMGFIITIILNLLLIPKYGAIGAAVGTGISLLITNVSRVLRLTKYYSLKTDYSIVFWLIVKFTPLVLICYGIIQQDLVHWLVLLGAYLIASAVIVYYSLSKNENIYLKAYIGKVI